MNIKYRKLFWIIVLVIALSPPMGTVIINIILKYLWGITVEVLVEDDRGFTLMDGVSMYIMYGLNMVSPFCYLLCYKGLTEQLSHFAQMYENSMAGIMYKGETFDIDHIHISPSVQHR
jgi:hypothetical protein